MVDNQIALSDFEVVLTEEDKKIKANIGKEFKSMGYSDICTIEELANGDKEKKMVIESMIGEEIVLLGDEYIISTELYNKAKQECIDFINKNGEMTLGEFRDIMDSSRKICMLILEHFDKNKITKRIENKRVLY